MIALLEFNARIDWWLLLAVPLIPLVGYVLQISFRSRWPWGDRVLTAGMFVVMCITVYLAAKAVAGSHHEEGFFHHSIEDGFAFRWLYTGDHSTPNIVAGMLLDPLGAVMLAVVGIVSFCVHLFSTGYMHGDRRYNIFFANISLFTFAMLGLVLADNILFLFIFWELMGLMSYLLIGHFSHDPSQPFFHKWATWASKKAFLTTRVGDCCLFVGIFMFWREFHTLQFTELWAAAQSTVQANGGEFPTWMTVAGLFVFGGTVGKSAQFPLHIWLPDAMAGPTPVSAMIHAATMVAAGVFLLGRMYPLLSPSVLEVVTFVGATTGLFAATIGLTCFDLKAVLAYSTISQLGFMVAAVGLGGLTAGMFHMVTHAFFKACLFLSAGSVIHGCHHVQDMRVMGGLWRRMPITCACMGACTLAIAGFPFFSGFYSKDAILLAGWARVLDVHHFSGWSLYGLLLLSVAAMLTGFYMMRLMFLTFFHDYRGNRSDHRYAAMLAAEGFEGPEPHGHDDDHGHEEHHEEHGGHHASHEPHESPWNITLALCMLAFFTLPVVAGRMDGWFEHMATPEGLYGGAVGGWVAAGISEGIVDHESHVAHAAHLRALIVSLIVVTLGLGGAWYVYYRKWSANLPAKITARLGPIYDLVRRRYLVDELVNATVVRSTLVLSSLQKWFDENVVDGLVNGVGRVNKAGGFFAAWFDRVFVDGLVNAVGMLSQSFSAAFRLLQTGRIQQYAAFAVGGALLLASILILA